MRFAERLLYCFCCGCGESACEGEVVVVAFAGRLVGQTAGQVEIWICSPWAMRLYRAVCLLCQRSMQSSNQTGCRRSSTTTSTNASQPNQDRRTSQVKPGQVKSRQDKSSPKPNNREINLTQRIRILPTNQPPHPPDPAPAINNPQTPPIPRSPNQPLPKSRNQLPRMNPHNPLFINKDTRIEQKPQTNPFPPLAETNMTPNSILLATPLNITYLRPGDGNTLGREQSEERVVVRFYWR